MASFDDVEEGIGEGPERIAVMGEPGVGKSFFVAGAPRPYFIDLEGGSRRIPHIARNKTPVTSWEELLALVGRLRKDAHPYQTIVIDTVDRAEFLCWEHLCGQHGVKSIEDVKKGFGKGFIAAYEEMRRLFGALEGLCEHRSLHVVMILHQKVQKVQNPNGSDYQKHAPKVDDKVGNTILEMCDHVLYATRNIVVSDEVFDGKRARAIGGEQRILRTTGGPGYTAKCRAAVPDPIPLSWHDWACHLAAGGFPRLLRETVRDNARRTGDDALQRQINGMLAQNPNVERLAAANLRLLTKLGGQAWQQAAAAASTVAASGATADEPAPPAEAATPAAEPAATN